MNQLELLQAISKYLARFSEQVKILNSNGEFSINIHAENLLINLLNSVYGLELKNVNHSESGNYPAIDLIDADRKTSYQVTSTNTTDKIKNTIEKFFRNDLYKTIKKVKVYIITGKQKSGYSQEIIQQKIDEEVDLLIGLNKIKEREEIGFSFDVKHDIIDKLDLYNELNTQNDFQKIVNVEKFLRQQFDKIEEKDNLSQYYQKLKNSFYDVVMDDEKGLTLDQIYVEPSFSIYSNSFRKEDMRLSKHSHELNVDSRYKLKEFIDETIAGQNFLELADSHRMVLILGYPGQGKSSFCKRFLNDYIVTRKNEKRDVYYFSLRNIRQARDFIFDPLKTLYEEACATTSMDLDKYNFNKSLLVLDGLDELYMRDNLKLEEIDKLCKELSIVVEKYSDIFIILTSRYGYIDLEKIYREKIIITQLSTLLINQQKEWLSKFKVYHPEAWLTNEKLENIDSENRYSHLKELIEQPLLLHMVASIKEEVNENTNRAKVYSQLFSELIERKYSKEGQLEIFQKIDTASLRELIREIAFGIFQTGNEYITKTELLKLSATQNFFKLLPEGNLKDSIKGIMISFYFKEVEKAKDDDFMEDKSNYAIEFLHKSLREFLTAEKIYSTIKLEFLDKRKSGKYFLDDPIPSINQVFSLFAKQALTEELLSHLREIIINDTQVDKVELVDRLTVFLGDFFHNDFMIKHEYSYMTNPIEASLRCFFGFWTVVSALGLSKNYLLTPDMRDRFSDFIRYLTVSQSHSVRYFDFSYQDLSETNLSNSSFWKCKFSKTNLTSTDLDNSRFSNCTLKDIEFIDYYLDDISFYRTIVKDIKFLDFHIDGLKINSSHFENVSFENTDVSNLRVYNYDDEPISTLTGLIFKEVRMDQSSMDELQSDYFNIAQPLSSNDIVLLVSEEEAETKQEQLTDETTLTDNYRRIVVA